MANSIGLLLLLAAFFPVPGFAKIMSGGTVATGYLYDSNIFFTPDGPDDFVYFINPTLRIDWKPDLGGSAFSAGISSPLEVYTQNIRETNFGDNILFKMQFDHELSRRLSFSFQNDFRRVGTTRTGINAVTSGVSNQRPGAPALPVFVGETELTSVGEFLTNIFLARFTYAYMHNVTITGGYIGQTRVFLDEGGNASSHNVGSRLTYRLNEKWSLPFGYQLQVINSRNGDQDIVHNVDLGGSYEDEILPTLTVFLSTGLGIRATDSGGPAVINNVHFRLNKLWQTARGEVGVTRALTGSLGVAGPSTTTTVFGNYSIQLLKNWTAFTGARASFFDTSETNFLTVQTQVGLQYQINTWLFASLRYLYRMRNAGSGAQDTVLATSERIQSNGILLSLGTDFDLWPNISIAKGQSMLKDGRLR